MSVPNALSKDGLRDRSSRSSTLDPVPCSEAEMRKALIVSLDSSASRTEFRFLKARTGHRTNGTPRPARIARRCRLVGTNGQVATTTADAASATPTDGRQAYKLDRTGRKTVRASVPIHQNAPKRTMRRADCGMPATAGRQMTKYSRRTTAANVADRSKYAGVFSISLWTVKLGR